MASKVSRMKNSFGEDRETFWRRIRRQRHTDEYRSAWLTLHARGIDEAQARLMAQERFPPNGSILTEQQALREGSAKHNLMQMLLDAAGDRREAPHRDELSWLMCNLEVEQSQIEVASCPSRRAANQLIAARKGASGEILKKFWDLALKTLTDQSDAFADDGRAVMELGAEFERKMLEEPIWVTADDVESSNEDQAETEVR